MMRCAVEQQLWDGGPRDAFDLSLPRRPHYLTITVIALHLAHSPPPLPHPRQSPNPHVVGRRHQISTKLPPHTDRKHTRKQIIASPPQGGASNKKLNS